MIKFIYFDFHFMGKHDYAIGDLECLVLRYKNLYFDDENLVIPKISISNVIISIFDSKISIMSEIKSYFMREDKKELIKDFYSSFPNIFDGENLNYLNSIYENNVPKHILILDN